MSEIENIVNVKVKESGDADEDFVDPWNVVSKSNTGIDYDKLISMNDAICL